MAANIWKKLERREKDTPKTLAGLLKRLKSTANSASLRGQVDQVRNFVYYRMVSWGTHGEGLLARDARALETVKGLVLELGQKARSAHPSDIAWAYWDKDLEKLERTSAGYQPNVLHAMTDLILGSLSRTPKSSGDPGWFKQPRRHAKAAKLGHARKKRGARRDPGDKVRGPHWFKKYGIDRPELIRQTRPLYEEAYKADPHYVEELTRAVTGHEVFAWDNLDLKQLSALRRGLLLVVSASRGDPRHFKAAKLGHARKKRGARRDPGAEPKAYAKKSGRIFHLVQNGREASFDKFSLADVLKLARERHLKVEYLWDADSREWKTI